MKKIFIYFILLSSVLLLTFCSENVEEKIETNDPDFDIAKLILDWYPNANHAGLYSAVKYDHFMDNKINIIIDTPSDPATILSLVSHQDSDFGIFYQPDLLLARSQGVPVIAVASIVNEPLNALMTLKDSGISRPKDLASKKIGYPGIDWNRSMLATMLESDGLSIVDVELIDVGWSLAPALMSGEVDAIIGAYWTHESIIMEEEGYDIEVIMPNEWGVPPYYELILVTSEKTLEDDPNYVKRMVNSISAGYTSAIEDSEDALRNLIVMNPPTIDEEIESKGIELLVPIWQNNQNPEFGRIDETRWNEFSEWMKSRKLIPADMNTDMSFSNVFLD